jgi:SAM-dependent methyltransferase
MSRHSGVHDELDRARRTPQEVVVTNQRDHAYGQSRNLTSVDRLGVWLSARAVGRMAGDLTGKRIGDFGCGYDARLVRQLLPIVSSAAIVDVELAPDLIDQPKVTAHRGLLPKTMADIADRSLDLALCMSVLEHLDDPHLMLAELRRVLVPGGTCIVNVPNWFGKRFLELFAFRLGLAPADEMDDHRTYYDPRDLWPMLVRAGFLPHNIRCFRHKFGMNTLAVCRLDP